MTTRREFFKVVAATAAVAIVPTIGGVRLLRTRLARGDAREVVQYTINDDNLWLRFDILYPHRDGYLMQAAPDIRCKQYYVTAQFRGHIFSAKQMDAEYRQPMFRALEAQMARDGVGVYDLQTYKLPVPAGVQTPDDYVVRADKYPNRWDHLRPSYRGIARTGIKPSDIGASFQSRPRYAS